MPAKVRSNSAPPRLSRECPVRSPPKVPRATRGPFGATFEGLDPDSMMYRIQIYGSDGEHAIFRRYSQFLNLRAQLCACGHPKAVELPPLPPKSVFFRKNFSEKFMFQRAACLRSLFQSVMEIDRFVSTEALCRFLAVGKASSGPGSRKPSWKVMSWVPEDFAGESEVEEEEEEVHYPSSLLLADSEDAVGFLPSFQDQPSKVGPPAPAKKPSRRVPGRLQRARGRMCLLLRTEEPQLAANTF